MISIDSARISFEYDTRPFIDQDVSYAASENANLGDSTQSFMFATPYGQVEIELIAPVPEWFVPSAQKVMDLGVLAPNWDSYGAVPIKQSAIEHALHLLVAIAYKECPEPAIVPVANGAIQFEWNKEHMGLEIEITSPTEIEAYYEMYESGDEWEGSMFPDSSRVWKALKALKQHAE